MFEIILLLLILGTFIYGTIYFQNNEKDQEGNKEKDMDIVFIVTMVFFCSAFVFGIIFSEKFIKYLMSFSKLVSIAMMLKNIKSFFIGESIVESQTNLDKPKEMVGGGNAGKIASIHNNMYEDDDLPDSDCEEDY